MYVTPLHTGPVVFTPQRGELARNQRNKSPYLVLEWFYICIWTPTSTAREIKNPFWGLSGITSLGLVRSQFRQEISQVARSTSPITGTGF